MNTYELTLHDCDGALLYQGRHEAERASDLVGTLERGELGECPDPKQIGELFLRRVG